jgi:putative oxidoreductase
MNALISLYFRLSNGLDRAAPALLPLLARLVFAGVLLIYFWASGLTKLGSGVLGFLMPSDGAYIQIFPRAAEAFGYDFSQFGVYHWAVVTAGTLAEFILPLLLLLGLFTRLAALGMIGFVAVQTATDVVGHGVAGDDLGAWFDRTADALILDQRSLWIFLLLVPLLMGGGRFALDRLVQSRLGR